MTNHIPVYQQLVENIKEKITKGEYRVGDKIMSEREMAKLYGINRLTVRNAIAKLIEEECLISIQGKGTFVLGVPNSSKRIIFGDDDAISLSVSLIQSGFISTREVISFKKISCDDQLNEIFRDHDSLYELIRLSKIDGQPYALQICYFPARLFKDPERFDFSTGSLYTYMDTQGHMPKKLISNMQAIHTPVEYCDILKHDVNRLLFYCEYFGFDNEHQLIEFTRSYYLPKYTEYKYKSRKY